MLVGARPHTKTWNELAKHKCLIIGESESTVAVQLLQNLGLILHRENARAIMQRFPCNGSRQSREVLAAAAAS